MKTTYLHGQIDTAADAITLIECLQKKYQVSDTIRDRANIRRRVVELLDTGKIHLGQFTVEQLVDVAITNEVWQTPTAGLDAARQEWFKVAIAVNVAVMVMGIEAK